MTVGGRGLGGPGGLDRGGGGGGRGGGTQRQLFTFHQYPGEFGCTHNLPIIAMNCYSEGIPAQAHCMTMGPSETHPH